MSKTRVSRATFDEVIVPTYAPSPVMMVRGKGSRLWDDAGRQYIDFAGGIAVSAVGHCHPRVVKALIDQGKRVWHLSNGLVNEPELRLAKQLTAKTFADRVFFANSGAEANEAALKLARRVAYDNEAKNGKPPKKQKRIGVIAFDDSFHGRTLFTVNVGGQPKYSTGFGPAPAGIRHLPFNDLAAVKKAISKKTCCVIVEPLQGEGGIRPATKAFLKGLRELCDKHGALLIFDEVQCGAGRTGALYAYQKFGVTPDILTSAKGLGGGFPIGAMLTTEKLAKHFAVGVHGTTYGGNPLACAVADTVLDIVSAKATLKGVEQRHKAFVAALTAINDRHQVFSEIRGMGLLIGCELAAPWKGRGKDFQKASEEHGLMHLIAGPDVLRFAPSLLIPPGDMKLGMKRLEAAIAGLVAAQKKAGKAA
jgi:acetylornithine/N-succinyldiaminopimelate aminotransferase